MSYNLNEDKPQLGLIVLESCQSLGEKVNKHIIKRKKELYDLHLIDEEIPESLIVPITQTRFSNGEGKIWLSESVRGKDIYILCDVGNYSCTYDMYGFTNHKGPDEHFQDIKRVLSAIGGKSKRITVVMPLLYASRQHKRKGRESLDCALALQELKRMGVSAILSFDVHDPSIQNSIPLTSFENLFPSVDIVKALTNEEGININKEKMLIISPDTGAMERAIYYSSFLGLDIGLFYKRRDHSRVVNGKNPIVSHEYVGRPVDNMDILIIDDMIASGESVLDIVGELKKRNAGDIYVASTFAMFTEGTDKFEELYKDGLFKKVFSTNLSYLPENLITKEWFSHVDVSGYLARVIDNLNYDRSIEPLLNTAGELRDILAHKIKS